MIIESSILGKEQLLSLRKNLSKVEGWFLIFMKKRSFQTMGKKMVVFLTKHAASYLRLILKQNVRNMQTGSHYPHCLFPVALRKVNLIYWKN